MAFVKRYILLIVALMMVVSCSVTKFVPEGESLLNSVKIISLHDANMALKAESYIRQHPNSKFFGIAKVPLHIYSSAGSDTTKWNNRLLKKIGEPPVIYSSELAEQTRYNIEQMLRNDGYLHATVDLEERVVGERRIDAIYYLHERRQYRVKKIALKSDDRNIVDIIRADSSRSLLRRGMPFSVDNLEAERRRLTEMLKEKGYYRFQKDYISFTADTTHHSTDVNLTMNVALARSSDGKRTHPHKCYRINSISYVSGAGMRPDSTTLANCDTMRYDKYKVYYKDPLFVRPRLLTDNTYIENGTVYTQSNVDRTYNAFSQLSAMRYSAMRMVEHPDESLLDCYIMLEPNKRRTVSLEIEGTNTAGDLGAAVSATFLDKNLFRGSELLSLRLFGAYEAISGLSGYTRDSYIEYGAELSLRLFGGIFSSMLPMQKKLLKSSTQLSLKFNSQERPEFDRKNLSATFSYMWSKSPRSTHKFDILDVSYIYVPWISETFKAEYLDSISNRNSILKYNYENMLITKMGHSYNYNSSYNKAKNMQRMVFALRTNIECSGNLLNGISMLFNGQKNSDNQYTFMNIAYAQYVKGDIDFTTYINFDERNQLVFHAALGIAYPYGNSTILPFEKRYFAGGANSLRGWTVRGLGPGSYNSVDSDIDFINQSGDLKMDCNIELRSRLFWKLHSALFIDAGNIWTIREYREQPGGQFDIKSFHKDIAFSYGLGLRFEFDLFVFRLDAGMKAVNPARRGKERYPFLHPDLSRDFALHFAIGYPF
ncbi:MAG: BamA/TamA family outer membrane protein [Bacteroidaceae bacterium]|nr:BamA/TamA family outer membrane protein [Bacteroidaceae bacterium]